MRYHISISYPVLLSSNWIDTGYELILLTQPSQLHTDVTYHKKSILKSSSFPY